MFDAGNPGHAVIAEVVHFLRVVRQEAERLAVEEVLEQ